MLWPSVTLLLFVTLQRIAELGLARRNTRALLALGAHEVGAGHYPYIVLLHTTWLIGLWLLATGRPVSILWLAIFIGLQFMRLWVLTALKRRWTTRIIVLPGAPLVRSGPYRFIRHPNYVIVAGEVAVLPLAFGLPVYALVFSLLNALLLRVRIATESAALRS